MSFETFAANIDDLWFPAMDDIVSVLHSDSNLMVLVLDHEENHYALKRKLSRKCGMMSPRQPSQPDQGK